MFGLDNDRCITKVLCNGDLTKFNVKRQRSNSVTFEIIIKSECKLDTQIRATCKISVQLVLLNKYVPQG